MEEVIPGGGMTVVKARFGDDLRRFLVSELGIAPEAGVPTFSNLELKLKSLFGVKSKKLRISYLDKDGDTVTMACDNDLRDALVEQTLDPLRITLHQPRYHSSGMGKDAFEGGSGAKLSTDQPMMYKLSRAIKSVTEVWDEYIKGINGGPAVCELERDPIWKKQEKQYLSRRRAVYEHIRSIARERKIGTEAAAQLIEQSRIESSQTLAQLQQDLCDRRALEFGRKRKRLDEDVGHHAVDAGIVTGATGP